MTGGDAVEPKAWLVRGSKNSAYDQWMLAEGFTGIDFREIPDLSTVEDLASMRELVRSIMPHLKPGAIGNYAAQLFAFSSRISLGDLVILPVRHSGKLAFGVVTGGYEYRSGEGNLNHVRSVDWRLTDVSRTAINQDLLYSLGAFSTVVQISRNDAAWRFWQQSVEPSPIRVPVGVKFPPPPLRRLRLSTLTTRLPKKASIFCATQETVYSAGSGSALPGTASVTLWPRFLKRRE